MTRSYVKTPGQEVDETVSPPGGNTGNKTGVVKLPTWSDLIGWKGSMPLGKRNPTQTPAGPTTPPVIDRIREVYGGLENQLGQLTADEAQRISQSTQNTLRALQSLDPMASYRESAPMLAAPQAAASSYLGAIGANPAQVQAQQALTNQLLSSQAGSQSSFSQAMNDYLGNYRQAQQADVYTNQDRALAAMNYATQAQRFGLNLARMQEENAIRKMLLEYQLALATQAINKGGGGVISRMGRGGLPFAGDVLF